MNSSEASTTKVVFGVTLRADPAREPCFEVVQDPANLHDYHDMSEVSRRQRTHRHMHNEMQSIEISAQCLADFPDAPWDLRMELARQCWDETRHGRLLFRRLQEMGGRKGEFPVMNYEWSISSMPDNLAGRLVLHNRSFEGGEMDLLKGFVAQWREAGDERSAELLDGILADEVHHVRFANRWLKRMVKDDPKVMLQMVTALNYFKQVTDAYSPKDGDVNVVGGERTELTDTFPLDVEERRLAEFTEDEIAALLRKDGLNAVVP